MKIYEIEDNLYLIDLPQKLRGFRKFISSWVYRGEFNVVVDPGPKSTINSLVEALKKLEIKKVDYVLLTHIHIDHAGGVGEFLKHFNSKVLVNEKGKKHLINPKKLWEGSLKVLGDIAKAYGGITPVPESAFVDKIEGIEKIDTPGHAPHHSSYVIDDYLFVGEAFGVFHQIRNEIYQRPATPPKFILEIAENSIENLESLGKKKVCFGHFGIYDNSLDIAKYSKKQLRNWIHQIFDEVSEGEKSFDEIAEKVKNSLLEKDVRFSNYRLLEEDIKEREDYFIKNSIMGMFEYVKENML